MGRIVDRSKFRNLPNYHALFKAPPFLVSKNLSIWIKNNELPANSLQATTRFGVIVAKKHVKMAVARNKVKRLGREVFKNFRDHFKNKDLVIVIKNCPVKIARKAWIANLYSLYAWLDHFVKQQSK